MSEQLLRERLSHHFKAAPCEIITGDGVHFQATIIATEFEGLSKLKRQQLVYSVIGDLLQSGKVHAIELTTLTPTEWQNKNG